MRINRNNRRFIYLISPKYIKNNDFYDKLKQVLSSNKVNFFQLRLKNTSALKIIKIGKKIKKITKKNKVKLLINDNPFIAKIVAADGCHIGQKDVDFKTCRKILGKKKIIGVTCHNSLKLAKNAIKSKASYLAFGAFYQTKTKKTKFHATIKTLKEVKKLTNIPIVAIGGINSSNYKKLLLNKANFLAISSYIWHNKNYKPKEAIELLK